MVNIANTSLFNCIEGVPVSYQEEIPLPKRLVTYFVLPLQI